MSTSTREGFCSLLCHCAPTKKKTDTVILEGHHQLCLLETKNLRKCKNTSIHKLPAKKTNKKEELQNTRKFNVGQVRAGSWLCRVIAREARDKA